MQKDDRDLTSLKGAKEAETEDENLRLDPEQEFAQQVEHFAQKAHTLATMAGKKTIAPWDLYKHLEALWEQISELAKRLAAPVEREKPAILGLTSEEAELRLEQFGPNQTVKEKKITFLNRLWDAVKNPLVILLLVLGTVAFLTDDMRSTIVIISMAVIGVALKVIQESKADTAAAQLKAMVHTTATVLRDGVRKEIPLAGVVPGDIVSLSAGDMIPADVQLLKAKDLYVNQATLTGEAMPVEKMSVEEPTGQELTLDNPSMCFMGTNVESGSGLALVMATGTKTYFGGIAAKLAEKRVETDFDKGIKKFTMLMLGFMAFMVPFVFLVNGYFKSDWAEAFMFALAVAVGLTPEMLPMVVTVCLSKGALAMSKQKVIVKRLESIQNFGAIDVLCTDKTGTLTQDKIILQLHLNVSGDEDDSVLEYACVNSLFQTGLKSAIDDAVIHDAQRHEINTAKYVKIDEIPFDFKRRRMSVVVKDTETGKVLLICKGAAEEVFDHSVRYLKEGALKPLEGKHLEKRQRLVTDLNEDGFRVVGLAYKEVDASRSEFSVADESELIFMGYLGFLDPPKETAAEALRILVDMGITPKILTGDNPIITANICAQVGLDDGGHIITGDEVGSMSDEELALKVEEYHVFAKLDPLQKERIVTILRKNGHVVGFMGDGINDAPALKAADVGISVDSAVDIAKESADIILLEKSLIVLEKGVLEGRKVFCNITKYIRMGASSNFGNMFSVLGASAFLPFLPMLPIQILVNNLMYDFSQTAMPTDNVDEDFLKRPRRWRIEDIKGYILTLGPISSLFDYTTFFVMLYAFNCWDNPSLFQTGWFIESLLSQTLIVHVIRTDKIPFFQSKASVPLTLTTLGICCLGLWFPFSPFAGSLGLVALPNTYWLFLVPILFCYLTLTQLLKTWLVRKLDTGWIKSRATR
ncbi:magnesium-translocating P-type ATPase [Fundidesulfovibrio putealis]|uniref:magnesium-translocating P-type ATPase n=1 Tax=Fundidesulfovibrio putealis TaxID=270496 RepID=UPI0003F55FE1|nr:magnesium-translocating P-type ATPase [Fundidesulfovibrio putealis]